MPHFVASLTLLLLALPALADPLRDSLEIGTSISHAYDARSTFTNPAALGYQTELNGTLPLSAFSYGSNQGFDDEFSTGLSYGYLGLGLEHLSSPVGKQRRYSFALGTPVRPPFYLGMRYLLNRPDDNALERFDSFDLGLQWRPSRFFSLGILANGLNRTVIQYVGGVVVRPIPRIELTADVDTPSVDFGGRWGYQGTVGLEIARGFQVRGGYHKDYKWQAGFSWNFGMVSLHSAFQPASDGRRLVMGVQMAPLPYPSGFHPEVALKLEIDGSLSEEPSRGGLFSSERPSLVDLLEKLREAEKHPPRLLVLRIERFPLGLASAQEVFEALSSVRRRGVRIEAFLSSGGLKEYLIASVAHKIHMEPGGELRLWGLKAERYFITGTLEKLGVEAEFRARGEYKSAPEMFTRKESSPLAREMILEELKHAEELLLPLVGRFREMTPERWKATLKASLFGAESAKRAGLIDNVVSYKLAVEELEDNFRTRESLDEMRDELKLPSRVAVVIAHGDILAERFRLLGLGGHPTTTPKRLESHFTRALSDPRTKAIVLRVNSPGGEVLASQEIASIVENAKREKPVIVSMGDVAASGGYMISAPGHRIFANTLTMTGSIGVFLGKFNLGGLYKKLDLNKEILSHAPYPGLLTEHRPWTKAENEIMVRRLNEYYEEFVSFVGKWRNLAPPDAEKAAKGRVWLGDRAKGLGLVDENGGYREAIDFAVAQAGIPADHYEVWTVTQSSSLFGLFPVGDIFGKSEAEALGGILTPALTRDLVWMMQVAENPFLYLSPVSAIE